MHNHADHSHALRHRHGGGSRGGDSHSHDHGHGGHGHGHGHSHGHGHAHAHSYGGGEGNKKGLMIALIITTGIMFLEFVGGLLTNSLALLSDSGHMLSDAGALALSLGALWFSARPASPGKTYGFYRFEILAALFNGIALFVIAGFIVWEAVQRFDNPPVVASGSMIVIALIGLLANAGSAFALMRKGDVQNNVNLRSAYLHVIGDALGSVGAVVSGILMLAFQWYAADPIISILVAVLILRSAWGVIQHTVHILMEGTPAAIDRNEVKDALLGIAGVKDVHDLHIWTITSGFDALSCHVLIEDGEDSQCVLRDAVSLIKERFHIEHATIQVEDSALQHGPCRA